MGLLSGIIGGATGFMGARAQKKQTKNMLRDYNDAETNSLAAFGGARDASLGYYNPYLQGGTEQFNAAANMLAPGYDYTTSPRYQYLLDEMQNATTRGAAAGGSIGSGGFYRALQRNAAGIAGQGFDTEFGQRNALAGYGMQAANGMSLAQNNYARGVAETEFGAADGRTGARERRGDAIQDQWTAGGNLISDIGRFFKL